MRHIKVMQRVVIMNVLCGLVAAAVLALPREGSAAPPSACDDKQCDGIFYCEPATGLQCFKGSLMQPECLTRQCAVE